MMRTLFLTWLLFAASVNTVLADQTAYQIGTPISWKPDTAKGLPRGAFYVVLRGKTTDKCGQLIRTKFSDGFIYPWHVNNVYAIITVISGTLVVGFDRNRRASSERILPPASVIQGLVTEPHYGRAVGETIFDVYLPCGVR